MNGVRKTVKATDRDAGRMLRVTASITGDADCKNRRHFQVPSWHLCRRHRCQDGTWKCRRFLQSASPVIEAVTRSIRPASRSVAFTVFRTPFMNYPLLQIEDTEPFSQICFRYFEQAMANPL